MVISNSLRGISFHLQFFVAIDPFVLVNETATISVCEFCFFIPQVWHNLQQTAFLPYCVSVKMSEADKSRIE